MKTRRFRDTWKNSWTTGDIKKSASLSMVKFRKFLHVVELWFLGDKDHGKSQLINTLRGTNSAYTVTSSCTSPMPYVYPFNSNIQFWELPPIAKDGRYKKDKFIKEINAERYDMVLMLTANRYRKRI